MNLELILGSIQLLVTVVLIPIVRLLWATSRTLATVEARQEGFDQRIEQAELRCRERYESNREDIRTAKAAARRRYDDIVHRRRPADPEDEE